MNKNKNCNELPSVRIYEELKLRSEISGGLLEMYQKPHRMELGCFLIVNCGEVCLSINLIKYKVSGKSITTILPRHILQVVSCSSDFRCEIIAFQPEFVQ